jgi:hypothetical protein
MTGIRPSEHLISPSKDLLPFGDTLFDVRRPAKISRESAQRQGIDLASTLSTGSQLRTIV